MKNILTYTFCILLTFVSFSQTEESIYRDEMPYMGEVEIVWERKVGPEIEGAAIIDGNHLYMVISNSSSSGRNENGQLCALNKIDGSVIWTSDKHNDLPLHGAQLDGNELFYTTRRKIVSVDKSSGKTNWVAQNPFSMMIGSSCGIGKNAIVAGTADGDVFAVSRKDGKQFWETKLLNIDTPPMYSFKDLFLVADSEKGVYAIDANSGKIKWEYNSECGEYMNLQGNKAFFGNGNRGFTCINLENGKEIWTKDIDDGNPFVNGNKYFCASGFSSTPVIIGDVIYGGDYTHTVAAMNKNTGEVLWVDYFPKLNRTGINAYKNGLILSSEEAITLVNLKGGIVAKYKLPASMVNKESANEIAVDGDYLILTNEKGKVARVTLKNF